MRYLKMMGLAAIVAANLVVFASSASATELDCGTSMCSLGTEFHAELDGSLTFHQTMGDIECKGSNLEGAISNTGSSSETINATLSTLAFAQCNTTMTILSKGTLAFHTKGTSSDNNGLLTSSGTEITQELAGFHCIFKTSSTGLGTVTGSATTGGHATLDIEATVPRTGGRSGAFCGSTAQWTGAYVFTSPTVLNIT